MSDMPDPFDLSVPSTSSASHAYSPGSGRNSQSSWSGGGSRWPVAGSSRWGGSPGTATATAVRPEAAAGSAEAAAAMAAAAAAGAGAGAGPGAAAGAAPGPHFLPGFQGMWPSPDGRMEAAGFDGMWQHQHQQLLQQQQQLQQQLQQQQQQLMAQWMASQSAFMQQQHQQQQVQYQNYYQSPPPRTTPSPRRQQYMGASPMSPRARSRPQTPKSTSPGASLHYRAASGGNSGRRTPGVGWRQRAQSGPPAEATILQVPQFTAQPPPPPPPAFHLSQSHYQQWSQPQPPFQLPQQQQQQQQPQQQPLQHLAFQQQSPFQHQPDFQPQPSTSAALQPWRAEEEHCDDEYEEDEDDEEGATVATKRTSLEALTDVLREELASCLLEARNSGVGVQAMVAAFTAASAAYGGVTRLQIEPGPGGDAAALRSDLKIAQEIGTCAAAAVKRHLAIGAAAAAAGGEVGGAGPVTWQAPPPLTTAGLADFFGVSPNPLDAFSPRPQAGASGAFQGTSPLLVVDENREFSPPPQEGPLIWEITDDAQLNDPPPPQASACTLPSSTVTSTSVRPPLPVGSDGPQKPPPPPPPSAGEQGAAVRPAKPARGIDAIAASLMEQKEAAPAAAASPPAPAIPAAPAEPEAPDVPTPLAPPAPLAAPAAQVEQQDQGEEEGLPSLLLNVV